MIRGGNREMRRMLDKMGLEMKDLGSIEEVIIKTETKELYLIKPQVIEMKGKDSTIFQIIATAIEEKKREIPAFKEEDNSSINRRKRGYSSGNFESHNLNFKLDLNNVSSLPNNNTDHYHFSSLLNIIHFSFSRYSFYNLGKLGIINRNC